jgi:hypothetical protein
MFIPRAEDVHLAEMKQNLISPSFLSEPDACGTRSPPEYVVEPFPTNGDRFAAQEVSKRQDTEGFTRMGFILQAIAAGWHHKSAAQLKTLADEVGRSRIRVLHGIDDRMVTFPHGRVLFEELGGEGSGVAKWFVKGRGHYLPFEERDTFRKQIEEAIAKGLEENRKGDSRI